MAAKFENITSQITGTNDIFTLGHSYVGGTVSIGYNGQLYPVGVNIKEEIPTDKVQLTFTPTLDTDTLLVIYDDGTDASQVLPILMASALPPRTSI